MGFIADIRFPISDGVIVTALRDGLTAKGWGAGLSGGTKLPSTVTARMFTVRDDSGPQSGRVSARRQGVNLWADTAVDALNMALDGMSICRLLADGSPIVSVGNFTGPYEIPDDPEYVVSSKSLTHYYFTFVAAVKGSAP